MKRPLIAAIAVVCSATPALAQESTADTDGRYREFGDAGGFRSVSSDTEQQYGALMQSPADVAPDALGDYYLDASFGVAPEDVDREYEPHPDARVIRDKSRGIAHIFGQTRYSTMYAQGYTTAEDRLAALIVLRALGRGRLSELVGLGTAEALDRAVLATAPYSEDDLRTEFERLRGTDAGAAVADDLRAYADGINGYLAEAREDPTRLPEGFEQPVPEDWEPEDTMAVANAISAAFGRGGGHELANHCNLSGASPEFGDPESVQQQFDALSLREDLDARVIAPKSTPYPPEADAFDVAASPAIDCASLQTATDTAPGLDVLHTASIVAPTTAASLLIGATASASERPIALLGTDAPFGAEDFLIEKDVHGPGIDARGVGITGLDLYVFAGRGDTYAFTAAPSGADNVDMVVLRLCDPQGNAATADANRYEHNGRCVPFDTWTHELRAPDGERDWSLARAPDYGPVLYRGQLADGTPVAVAEQRSTYGHEMQSLIGLRQLNDSEFMQDGYSTFREVVANRIDYALSWTYVDAHDIGYQHSCLCPVRTPTANPVLPVDGTGPYDWSGFIEGDAQPAFGNPQSQIIAAWGNRLAPEWSPGDDETSWGLRQRVDLLYESVPFSVEENVRLDPSTVVELVRDGSLTDMRGRYALPDLLSAMDGADPPDLDIRAYDARERLEIWADDGATRADRDGDGTLDDPVALALMGAFWPHAVDAVFGTGLFGALGIAVDSPTFESGAYTQMTNAMSADGECRGELARCGEALWRALEATVVELETEFGTPDVDAWERTPADLAIPSTMVGAAPLTQNRAPFEQLV